MEDLRECKRYLNPLGMEPTDSLAGNAEKFGGGGRGSNWNSLPTCNAHQFIIRNHREGISRRECKEMLGT